MTTTTLNTIRAASPCHNGWTKLLKYLGKTSPDDEPLHLLTILESNGLEDTLWVLDNTKCDTRLARHFSAWCAEQVLHIFEDQYPTDMRPRSAITIARDDMATENERKAASDAAWAASEAASDDASEAASDAAKDAAWAAAKAAWAASDDPSDATWAAASGAQLVQFRKMLMEGF